LTGKTISARPYRQERAAILAALARVSDPDSPQYGQHLTQSQVAEVATSKYSIKFVEDYLVKVWPGR